MRILKQRLGKQIFKNSLILSTYIFSVELIIRYILKLPVNYSVLRILISSLILGIFFSLLINNKFKKTIITLITTIILIYTWFETNLYFYLGFFMGSENTEQGMKVIDYFKEFFTSVKPNTFLLLIPYIIVLLYYFYLERKLKEKKLEKTIYFTFEIESIKSKIITYLISILIIIGLSLLYFYTLKAPYMQNKLQQTSNIDLFINPENANLAASQFGVVTYGLSDILLSKFNLKTNNEYIYKYEEKESIPENDYTRYVDNDIFYLLNDSKYNQLNNYFLNKEITPKNEYTGLFEGKNLIVILLESVNDIILNEELYPNIYKLYSEGFSFENNYSPRNACATGNNEFSSITSLYSISNTCTLNRYRNNTYFHSLFNMFNNENYITGSYHNYFDAYYSRKRSHLNLGSKSYQNGNDLEINLTSEYKEWPSDIDLIEKALPNFINEEKFMSYLITVTPHQPYIVNSEYGNKYLDKLIDYDYNMEMKRYLSKLFELDAAIGLLLEKLEESSKLSDTVIVLFGDHYPYGLKKDNLNNILPYDTKINNEVDRTPFIIYNSESKGEKIYKYTSLVDILPTLLNLFNINYDPRLYLGNDIFSDYHDLVIFADGSWQDKIGFYNASLGEFIPKDKNNTYHIDELISVNKKVSLKLEISTKIIKNNYFEHLNNKIKENEYE